MLLPRFNYHRPDDVDELCELLDHYKEKASVLAGGTDLLVDMKKKFISPANVISIEHIEELKGIQSGENGTLIGALTTAAELSSSRMIKSRFTSLFQAASRLGSPQIRNRATAGGNLGSARPAADLAPPLLTLEARLVLKSIFAEREIDIADWFTGPGESICRPNEFIKTVAIPAPAPDSGGCFLKLGVRKAVERSIVSVAVNLVLSSDHSKIISAKTALGAVAPTPILSSRAEEILNGAKISENLFKDASRAASFDACPRGKCHSPEYSLKMVEVLMQRALVQAVHNAKGDGARK